MRIINILVLTLFLSSCGVSYAHNHQPDEAGIEAWSENIVENHIVIRYKDGQFWAFPIIDRDTFAGRCQLKQPAWKTVGDKIAFAYCNKAGDTLGFLVNTEFAWECDTCADGKKHNSL